MIPKHLFRRLLDLGAPFTIAPSDELDSLHKLTVRHKTGGLVAVSNYWEKIAEPASIALGVLNTYLINDPNEQSLGGDNGALDCGKCPSYVITSKKLTAPIALEIRLVGNKTRIHYQDVAYIYVTIDDADGALYEMAEAEKQLQEVESYSLKSLPADVLGALAAFGSYCGRFDSAAAFTKQYGAANLKRLQAAALADNEAFVQNIFRLISAKRSPPSGE